MFTAPPLTPSRLVPRRRRHCAARGPPAAGMQSCTTAARPG